MYTLNSDTLIGHCHICSQEYNFIARFSTTTLVIAPWLYFFPNWKVFRKETRELEALIICNVHCVLDYFFNHLEQRIMNLY